MAKTALEQSREDWRKYNPNRVAEKLAWETNPQVEARWERAQAVARQAARFLKSEFYTEKVYLFGSLTHRSWFNPWSDIDLAVQGLPKDRFYAAVAAINDLSPDIKIDLVDLDHADPELRKSIEHEGVML